MPITAPFAWGVFIASAVIFVAVVARFIVIGPRCVGGKSNFPIRVCLSCVVIGAAAAVVATLTA